MSAQHAPGEPSEGHSSAFDILMAIGPLHGSERPDVGLRPYKLSPHRFARIDTGFAREGGMAVSNDNTIPLGYQAKRP